jgi:hypothetical protein
MANTTFSGPVRSENGFQDVTKNATTGAVTTNSTYGENADIGGTLDVTGAATLSSTANVIVVPTSDPGVAGALWNDAGTLSVSAG